MGHCRRWQCLPWIPTGTSINFHFRIKISEMIKKIPILAIFIAASLFVAASMPMRPFENWEICIMDRTIAYLENGVEVRRYKEVYEISLCTKRHYHPKGTICANARRYRCAMKLKDVALFDDPITRKNIRVFPGYVMYKKRVIIKFWL